MAACTCPESGTLEQRVGCFSKGKGLPDLHRVTEIGDCLG